MQAKYLSQIGGLTIEDSIRRILQSVMTADLARQYSFHGRGSKIAFSGLKLKSVVYGKPSMLHLCNLLEFNVSSQHKCGHIT